MWEADWDPWGSVRMLEGHSNWTAVCWIRLQICFDLACSKQNVLRDDGDVVLKPVTYIHQ